MKIVLATSMWSRIVGLLKTSRCTNGEVLMLAPCKSIHTFGMRTPLDLAFLNEEARVLKSQRNVPPNKMHSCAKAVAVLERRSNPNQSWPQEGDQLNLTGESVSLGTGKVCHWWGTKPRPSAPPVTHFQREREVIHENLRQLR